MSPQIEVIVLPSGETQIMTRGFFGAKCRDATKTLEVALGQNLSEVLTSEFHSCSAEQMNSTEHDEPPR